MAMGGNNGTWLLRLGRRLAAPLCRLLWRWDVRGVKNVPAAGPVLFAANHTAGIDGPFVEVAAPRPTHFLVKSELYHGPLSAIFRWIGMIEVDRSNGRAALTAALDALKAGAAVGIFPEGERGRGDVTQVRAGVAWLAVHGHAPVVPVACLGTRSTGRGKSSMPRLGARIVVAFGPPIEVERPDGMSAREAVARAADTIRSALADHVAATVEATGVPLPSDDVSRSGTPDRAQQESTSTAADRPSHDESSRPGENEHHD